MRKKYVIDCDKMTDRASAHAHIAEVLGFPEYYGNNLDALFDCLTDMRACDIKIINAGGLNKLEEYGGALMAVFNEAASSNDRIRIIPEDKKE